MSYLKEKILEDGIIYPNNVLKIDSFLNQQIDPIIMKKIADEFYEYYKDKGITKILTIEASGIAPAIILATKLNVSMLFAKKSKPSTLEKEACYHAKVYSYTKRKTSDVLVPKKYLKKDDKVLIIDDFLANGEASLGLVDLAKQAGSNVVGIGICVEKSFQPGRKRLEEAGLDVYSIVRIEKIDYENQKVIFKDGH